MVQLTVVIEYPYINIDGIINVDMIDKSKTLQPFPHKRITEPKVNPHGLPYIILYLVTFEITVYDNQFNASDWIHHIKNNFQSEFNMELKCQIIHNP